MTNRVRGPDGGPVGKMPDRMRRPPPREGDEPEGYGIGRILALSDGVFAIAVTLLILDIAIPATTSDDGLPHALLHFWPRYLAYALSFVVIARFWVIHHQTFRLIARDDTALMWLNLVLLLFVAFLPFPTAVLGDHGSTPAAATLYAAAVCLASTASAAIWLYASGRGKLLRPDVEPAQVRVTRGRSFAAPAFFALTVPIAAFAPYVAEVAWILAPSLARIASGWFLARKPEQAG